MIPGLLVTEGSNKGYFIEIPEQKPFWIGRIEPCNFLVEEAKVSSKHCCFLRKGEQLAVKDYSSNGTRLNGRKIHKESALLKYADTLQIGDTYFQVIDSDRSSLQTMNIDMNACLEELQKREPYPEGGKYLNSIGPYRTIEIIGEGSFGIVYKAVHERLQKLVALKVFSNLEAMGNEFVGRFLREVELLKKLEHHSIIRLYDMGSQNCFGENRSYIALEYFQGVNLTVYTKNYGPLPWPKALKILFQCTYAINYMHSHGILHRDIKPDNIMYNPIKEICKIIDLGLGKCVLDDARKTLCITQPNSSMGTPNFMPIEQWGDARDVDERADIYSLGATAYYLLSGEYPYGKHHDFTQLYRAVLQQQLKPLASLCPQETPAPLIKTVEKMMAFKASQRFSTSQKLMKHLQQIAQELHLL
jgi:serine/threonine protein kinase